MLTRRAFLVGTALALAGCDMRRLLMASGGAGSFPSPPLTGIPADGSWTRYGGTNHAVLGATQAWEQGSIQEPNMLPDGSGGWLCWASGSYNPPGENVGYYMSTDGIAWTHYASNPVLGGDVSQCAVYKEGSTLYLYGNSPSNTTNNPYVWSSSDGITWSAANGCSPYVSSGSITSWGNSTTWKEGSTYYMLQEGRVGAGAWKIYLLTSTSPTTGWSFLNSGNPLTSLEVATGGMYGGPMLATGGPIGGTYHVYYHAAPGSGNTPTDIYHATSTDRINWTIQNGGAPIITHAGSGAEVLQVADPDVHLFSGTWYMWWDATYFIELATAPAT